MHFEHVPKTPGHKFTLWWGKNGQFTLYICTNSHPYFQFYFFRDK